MGVVVENGELYCETAGAGRDLVLLHGGGLDASMWDGQFEDLAADHRVTRFDARSHGRSTAARGDYRAYEDLAAVLREVRAERPVLVGLSLGGRTAIDFALAYPRVPLTLVLVSTGVSGMTFADLFTLECQRAQADAAARRDADGFVEAMLRAWVDGPHRAPGDVPAAMREKCAAMMRDGLVRLSVEATGRMIEVGAVDRLAELPKPLLTVVGALDTSDIRGVSDELAACGAEQVVIDGAAHTVNMDRPEAFLEVLRGFLAKV
ncbi:pimeloyl-ACP methyl ester carboxylesterase [Catenuloplanes nepalensis]|uniref:Pimeloyl-ACP methyl ester carboxylesterase n=1 Tax=Catenuloplanes nepalensis TaxID=587533 RepID=A0ABT9MUV9_9ACTN|nr:alpha/beta hydrolase [Catenuloplanes nepalensis]MDP9795154.1 pimeloyl-ACP methyl ester carboxylesterase [Catenuloplanes nepalensis]